MISTTRTPMTPQSWAAAFGMPGTAHVDAIAAVTCALVPARVRAAEAPGTTAWRPPTS